MGILKRFLGTREADAALPHASASKPSSRLVSLQLLFPDKLDLAPTAVTRSLRAYHPVMARASCKFDAQASKVGTPIGFFSWADHAVRVVGSTLRCRRRSWRTASRART